MEPRLKTESTIIVDLNAIVTRLRFGPGGWLCAH